jgi:hypothetical protein
MTTSATDFSPLDRVASSSRSSGSTRVVRFMRRMPPPSSGGGRPRMVREVTAEPR